MSNGSSILLQDAYVQLSVEGQSQVQATLEKVVTQATKSFGQLRDVLNENFATGLTALAENMETIGPILEQFGPQGEAAAGALQKIASIDLTKPAEAVVKMAEGALALGEAIEGGRAYLSEVNKTLDQQLEKTGVIKRDLLAQERTTAQSPEDIANLQRRQFEELRKARNELRARQAIIEQNEVQTFRGPQGQLLAVPGGDLSGERDRQVAAAEAKELRNTIKELSGSLEQLARDLAKANLEQEKTNQNLNTISNTIGVQ